MKDSNLRTDQLYEQISAYPKPPMASIPNAGALLDELNISRNHWYGRLVTFLVVDRSGFRAFLQRHPEQLETILRNTYLRGGGAKGPTISATLSIIDDTRNLPAVSRAGALVMAAIDLHKDISSGKLAADNHRGQTMEMGQYPNLFSTKFVVEKNGPMRLYKTKHHSHMIVIVANRFYKVEIDGLQLEGGSERLDHTLKAIVANARSCRLDSVKFSPGVFTCCNERLQRAGFDSLNENGANHAALDAIKHSFLTLCLDLDDRPITDADALRMAHSLNPGNRWHYSSMQIVVFGNAKTSIIYSFDAYLDGNVMARSAAELARRSLKFGPKTMAKSDCASEGRFTKLRWQIPPNLFRRAHQSLRLVQDSQAATYTILGIGRTVFDRYAINSVSAFVIALAQTARQITGQIPQIIQLVNMSNFRCMGFKRVNSVTQAVVAFLEYTRDGDFEIGAASKLLKLAAESQQRLIKQNRTTLSAIELFNIFRNSITGLHRQYVRVICTLAALIGTLTRSVSLAGSDIIISHPAIFPEVSLVGRPGIRVSYAKYFALHYQIFDEHIILTVMPGTHWATSNSELAAILELNLRSLCSILTDSTRLS